MTDCPWDLNGDGVVDDADLMWLTNHWGPCTPGSKGDFNGDGTIDVSEVVVLQQHYGPCPRATTSKGVTHVTQFNIPAGATLKVNGVEVI